MLLSAVNTTKLRPFGIREESNIESTETGQTKCSNKTKKILCGIFFMIIISFSWVGALYLMKISFKKLEKDQNERYALQITYNSSGYGREDTETTYTIEEQYDIVFDAPFFATWFVSLWNILFLPVYAIIQLCCCNKENDSTRKMFEKLYDTHLMFNLTEYDLLILAIYTITYSDSIQGFMEKGFTLLQFFGRCGSFSVLWMITNYMLIFSLRILDITVVMAVFSCSVSIVYLLSWVVLHQQFVGIRIVAVIICNTGIALLVYMDGVKNRTLTAVTIVVGAGIGAAIYKVFFKRVIGYTSFAQMSLFFTLVGFMNAFLMWPLILLLYLCGAETIIWSQIPWTTLTGSAVLLLMANLFGNLGIGWTYELFLNLGIFCAIPIASVIDTFIYDTIFQDMKLAGVLLLLFGFIVVLLPDNWNEYLADLLRQRFAKWKRREQMKKNGRVQDTTTGQVSRLRTNSGRVK